MRGRAQIAETFASFLKGFETVYHANGQLTLALDGDRAHGTSYCLVALVSDVDGKKMLTSLSATYQDTYVRQGSRWLIAARKSTFAVRERRDLKE